MLTQAFVQHTRARVAEARSTLIRLRDASKEAARQLAKLIKQQAAERERLSDALGKLADGVYDALPEERDVKDPAWEREFERAGELRDEVENLAGDVDEVSLHLDEDAIGNFLDEIAGLFEGLKETEAQLSKLERAAVKLGV